MQSSCHPFKVTLSRLQLPARSVTKVAVIAFPIGYFHGSHTQGDSMETSTETAGARPSTRTKVYLPREHGATAMLLTPIFSVAILARTWHWSELAVLTAAFAAISGKDPAVLLLRQRYVWKRPSPEAPAAALWLGIWSAVLLASVSVLFAAWPFRAFAAVGVEVGAFACLAAVVNLKNLQRSTLFQIASAAALTSTSLATCLSATGTVAPWCWWFWLLITMQASGGILIVHARLDARIALRKATSGSNRFRHAAQGLLGLLFCAAITAAFLKQLWIALALTVAVLAYAYDLIRQKNSASLQMPLKSVGQQALAVSTLYSALLIAGLW